MPDPSAELADHLAIERLQSQYADVINRRAWAELHRLFVPDMLLHLDTVTSPVRELHGADQIGEFIGAAVQRFSFFEFVPLSSHIEPYPDGDHDAATARLWMCEVRCGADSHPGAGEWSSAYGLYRDAYRREGDRWWFAERRYRSLARTGADGGVLPMPDDLR